MINTTSSCYYNTREAPKTVIRRQLRSLLSKIENKSKYNGDTASFTDNTDIETAVKGSFNQTSQELRDNNKIEKKASPVEDTKSILHHYFRFNWGIFASFFGK